MPHHILVCPVPHQPPEGDNGRDAGEEHEEDGGHGLHVDGVCQI